MTESSVVLRGILSFGNLGSTQKMRVILWKYIVENSYKRGSTVKILLKNPVEDWYKEVGDNESW